MGNTLSRLDLMILDFHKDYYPKTPWLKPMYVLSGSFLGMIGLYLANNQKAVRLSQLSNFAFLLSLAGTFGAQLFHHFIQDPTLMRSLMRHQYGDVSNKIMSKYFFVTTLFTGIGSCLFLQAHPFSTWHGDVRLFGNLVLGSFLLNTLNATAVTPLKLKLMNELHVLERNANVGLSDLGFEDLDENLKLSLDPEYSGKKVKLMLINGLSMCTTVASFLTSGAQFYLIAQNEIFRI